MMMQETGGNTDGPSERPGSRHLVLQGTYKYSMARQARQRRHAAPDLRGDEVGADEFEQLSGTLHLPSLIGSQAKASAGALPW
jgi:hypothetical protein